MNHTTIQSVRDRLSAVNRYEFEQFGSECLQYAFNVRGESLIIFCSSCEGCYRWSIDRTLKGLFSNIAILEESIKEHKS